MDASFNSIEWIQEMVRRRELLYAYSPFNSIEWILHHCIPYSLWKVLSFPLHGFYSIKPPGGGSMYIVWGRVFKLFAHIPH